jgi:hypothetical protein
MEQGWIHSADLLESALRITAQLGYQVREDLLDGFPGGACRLKGKKWLFVDPSLTCRERLQIVLDALAGDPDTAGIELPTALAQVINGRTAA